MKLLDFGLAKALGATRLTKSGQVMGTPIYMAPEQLQGDPVDQRADIYSLGVIAYELLASSTPFSKDQFYSKVYRPPEAPSIKNPELSPAIDAVILRALSANPHMRQTSAEDLKWELAACMKDYVEFQDIPLMGQDWRTLLQSDLERLSVETTRVRERTQLVEGEERDVTLLVVRLLGLTGCQDLMAREGMGFVRDRTFRILANEVERYGGAVDRYEPNGLVAHFGSKLASEVECERAVMAGLGIHEKVLALNGMLSPRGITLTVGTGVDLARIRVGHEEKVDSGAFQITRDPLPDLIGGTWVTDAVRKRLSDHVQVEEGTSLHRIKGASPTLGHWDRRPEGLKHSPFVGRESHIRDLDGFFQEAMRDVNPGPGATLGVRRTKPTVVTLKGEPGIGKSRLLQEFLRARQEKWCKPALVGTSVSFLRSPFLLVTTLLRRWLDVTDTTPVDQVRSRLVERLAKLEYLRLGRTRQADLPTSLGYLLGFPEATKAVENTSSPSLQQTILQAVTELLLVVSQDTQVKEGRPQIVVFEDLQWIDDISLGVLEMLLTSGFSNFHVQLLGPLVPEEARRLVAAILGGQEPSRNLMDLIVRRAGGNPYFLEETVNLLIDERSLVREAGGWEVKVAEDSLTVPATIQALVLSRFDLLPGDEKQILQVCSVIGMDGDAAILEEMARELFSSSRDCRQALARLENMQFLIYREVDGRQAYTFRHALAREVVYSTILASNRRILHGLAARTIEKIYQGALEEHSALLAYHCNRSDEPARALHYTEVALRKAVSKYDHEGALRLAEEALKLLPLTGGDSARQFDVLALRERALEVTGRRDEQQQDLQTMLTLARSNNDEKRLSDAQNRLSWFHWWNVGDYAAAHKLAVAAMETKRKLKDRRGEADALRNLGCVHSLLGDFEEALRYHRRAQRLYEECNDFSGVGGSICNVALTTAQMGHVAEAIARAQEALLIDQKYGDRRGVGRELRTLGDFNRGVGADERALQFYSQALANDREIGYRQGEAANLTSMGTVFLNQGRTTDALNRFKEALEVALAINARTFIGDIFLGMATAYRERGNPSGWELSQVCAQNAHELGEELGIAGLTVMGISSVAFANLLLGNSDEALRLSLRAVTYLKGALAGIRTEEVWFTHSLILNKCGRKEETAAALERAHSLVMDRAERLVDNELRQSFLNRVSLNQRILIAFKHLARSTK
ncbi:MAG: tetratricopeptide repeat protein [Candidatus Riflebacteria bacterium]|nr:tetratricopeptide repeat protein [Candidatus Riflebacteria bacterium]